MHMEYNLLTWIESFLPCRTQQARVGSALSQTVSLISGVVQGSVLGPLLFLLYINDVAGIFQNSKCTCKLYADDLKISRPTLQIQLLEDVNVLPDALNALHDWSNLWQLSISYKKCSAMMVNVTKI